MGQPTEVSAKPNVKFVKIKNNPPVEVQTEERIPKLFNTEEPLSSLISDNFNKVKSDKVFAKSCSQPFGNTEACQKKESIKNSFNPWGLFISSAEAMPLAIPPPVISSSATMAAGTQNQSNNDKAARALTQVVGKFKDEALDNLRFFVETSPVINFSLMLFKALQFPDDTQHTEEELRKMQEVKSRIRVQIIEPEGDDVYPTVRAFHVGDGDDKVPVRYVGKNAQGQYSVVLEENGPTIYWSPDETGNQVPHTTPSQDDGVSFGDIWVNPLSDAVNDPSTVLPMPAESDWQDRILVFPEDSGIEPLYVVFSKTAYSAAYKTKLKSTSYPGVSRARHFQESNENLLSQMENDSDFKKMINDLGIDINRTPRGLAPRRPPIGWTWHHEKEKGVMILVPRKQHTIGSDEWKILHLDNKGGYSRWGKK